MANAKRERLLDPLFNDNPIALQVLGICSALAVTTKLETALVMSAAVTAVLVLSNVSISLLRNQIPTSIRIIVQLVDHRVASHRRRPDPEGLSVRDLASSCRCLSASSSPTASSWGGRRPSRCRIGPS